MPMFTEPLEPLSDEAIAHFCDADLRSRVATQLPPEGYPQTMIVRLEAHR